MEYVAAAIIFLMGWFVGACFMAVFGSPKKGGNIEITEKENGEPQIILRLVMEPEKIGENREVVFKVVRK